MSTKEYVQNVSDKVWKIANLLRGPYRPPQYRRVMIPMTVLRRLDSVLVDSKKELLKEYSKLKAEDTNDDITIEKILLKKFNLNFLNTSAFTFNTRAEGSYGSLLDDPDNIAANLTKYIAGFSSTARNIFDKFKFHEEIEKLDEANRLFEIVKEFASEDFNPSTYSNYKMGQIFEDLVRRFNEQANEEAGDHFTPREVIRLMVNLLFMDEDITTESKVFPIYDPTAGTGGILSIAEEHILEINPDAHIELFGQEYNPESYAICGSDLLIKGEAVTNIVYGNTLGTGKEKEGFFDGDGHFDKQMKYMAANPPFGVEWKPEKDYVTREHEELGFNGRFGPGLPRINDGALLFLLHMIHKMKPVDPPLEEGSRIAVVFNGSPLFTGDAGSGESNIRRWIIENDMLEAVVALPDQMFYNTGIFTYVWIVTNNKKDHRKGKIQLINAVDFAWRMKKSLGDKRKEIGNGEEGKPHHIEEITRIYGGFKNNDTRTLAQIKTNIDVDRDQNKEIFVSKIFNNADFGYIKLTVERPLRLNFAVTDERINNFKNTTFYIMLGVSKKKVDKEQIENEIKEGKLLQELILDTLNKMKPAFQNGEMIKERKLFEKQLKKAFKDAKFPLDGALKKVLLSAGVLGEKDPTAEICYDQKGNPEPDPDLRDYENVPLPKDIQLPLPLDYESKKTKGKVDNTKLVYIVKKHCEEYMKTEVLPYRPDAWVDYSKTKVGYEIPFNRHFYQYEPPRPLDEIEADIKSLENDILDLMKVVL